MTPAQEPKNSVLEIVKRLKADIADLTEAAISEQMATPKRRQLDVELRQLMGRVDILLRELDPVRQPRFVFDPGNPAVVGRFIALAMIAQPRVSLRTVERFYGSGVYALYYKGNFPAYAPIGNKETPIYVGKADPQADTAKQPIEQGEKLSGRLKDHSRNIGKAKSALNVDDFEYRCLVVQSGWQGAAEDYLIHLFKPVWNNETGICYGLGKHGDASTTRANLRSPWDTLHPGREWANDPKIADARDHQRILGDLEEHFKTVKIYNDLDAVLKGFIEELRQI